MHIDMDSFYASVEMLRNPDFSDKPLVVGMGPFVSQNRGAVAAANYPAREHGIRSGMTLKAAISKFKDVKIIPADKKHYKRVSDKVMKTIKSYSPVYEQISIDEVFLDVSSLVKDYSKAEQKAKMIQKEVLNKEKLTCSVGIGPNKLIAKMASGFKKPSGVTVVHSEDVPSFLFDMPIRKLYSVGPKIEEKLKGLGVVKIGDVQEISVERLVGLLGESVGRRIYNYSRGIDESPVSESEEKKSISRMTSFESPTDDVSIAKEKLYWMIDEMHSRLKKFKLTFRTITVSAVDSSMEFITKSKTIPKTDSKDRLKKEALLLIEKVLSDHKIRRIGVGVSNLEKASEKQQKLV